MACPASEHGTAQRFCEQGIRGRAAGGLTCETALWIENAHLSCHLLFLQSLPPVLVEMCEVYISHICVLPCLQAFGTHDQVRHASCAVGEQSMA